MTRDERRYAGSDEDRRRQVNVHELRRTVRPMVCRCSVSLGSVEHGRRRSTMRRTRRGRNQNVHTGVRLSNDTEHAPIGKYPLVERHLEHFQRHPTIGPTATRHPGPRSSRSVGGVRVPPRRSVPTPERNKYYKRRLQTHFGHRKAMSNRKWPCI